MTKRTKKYLDKKSLKRKFGLYVVGIDPYKFEKTTDPSVYIYKRTTD